MWTWCREHDKTSLGIHERGSEFLVTIGSFCQIWWGLHTAAGWNDLLREKEASLSCPLDDMCMLVCGRACACVRLACVQACVWMWVCRYMVCVLQERVPAECTWKLFEINWACYGLLETVQHACQSMYTWMHLCASVCVEVCGLQNFIYMCICSGIKVDT